jgi:WD40 repeat protein
VSLFMLGEKPMMAIVCHSIDGADSMRDSYELTVLIYDIIKKTFVTDLFECSEPNVRIDNKSGSSDEIEISIATVPAKRDSKDDAGDAAKQGFTVFVATDLKGGNIYVQPFKPKLLDSTGKPIVLPGKAAKKETSDEEGGEKSRAKKTKCLTGHQLGITALHVHTSHRDDNLTYLVSASKDKSVRLWNPYKFQMVYALNEHKVPVCSVTSLVHPKEDLNRELIVSADEKGCVCVWDSESGELLRRLIGPAHGNTQVCSVNTGRLPDDRENYEGGKILTRIVSSSKSDLIVSILCYCCNVIFI